MQPVEAVWGAAGALGGILLTYGGFRLAQAGRPGAPARDVRETAASEPDTARRLVDALPFAAFIVDAGGRVRVFNAAAAQLFAVDAGRALGRALIEVIPSVELERIVLAAIGGETDTRDIVFGTGTRERYVAVTAQRYENGAIAIAADRTAHLAAQKMRSDFIGNVSHELRTPLSSMKLMLETVLLADDDAEARAMFLPQLQGEVERMIRLVEDLLELARSESGTIALRREPLDLSALAAATAATFAQRAAAAGVDLRVEAPARVDVLADRGRLTQVLVNLLDNAVRHTPAGGRIAVGVRSEDGEGVVAVSDTGTGIPFADLPRVFERFYVVDRSRSRDLAGTGLGLAIAKHLVELHGGKLGVNSVFGEGSTFTMRIPHAAEPEIKGT